MGDYAQELARSWQYEIPDIERQIARFEAGEMRVLHNGIDVSKEHVAQLKRSLDNLQRAIAIIQGRSPDA